MKIQRSDREPSSCGKWNSIKEVQWVISFIRRVSAKAIKSETEPRWAFAHVCRASIGQDCNICDHVFIENDVVRDRVTVKSGVQLWDGLRVGSDVFIGPNATFTNDFFPKSRQRPSRFARTTLEEGCSIGANATILPGILIGRNAMVGAGAVVTRSVPPNAIVHGNPARVRRSSSQIDKAGRVEVPAKTKTCRQVKTGEEK
jgi:acetyltransferase-like isoleucine patch superfamily enzyme